MTNEELVSLIQSETDVQTNFQKLYKKNKGIIFTIIQPFSIEVDLEDLEQEAQIALFLASKNYVEGEYKFTTLLSKYVKFRIIRYYYHLRKQKTGISYQLLALIYQYNLLSKNSMQDKDIMQHLKINKSKLRQIKEYIGKDNVKSTEEVIGDNITIGDCIQDEFELDEMVCKKLLNEEIWKQVNSLPDKFANVINQRHQNGQTLMKIAEDTNASPQMIDQIYRKGLSLLRKNEKIREIATEYNYLPSIAYNGNFSFFKNTGCSSTELVALKNIEHENQLQKRFNQINASLESIFSERG